MEDEMLLDNSADGDSLHKPESDILKLLQEFSEANEEDCLPTKSYNSSTDETAGHDKYRSLKRTSIQDVHSAAIDNNILSDSTIRPDTHPYSSRIIRRKVNNEPTPSRSSSYISYSPIPSTPPSQHHPSSPSIHDYVYPTPKDTRNLTSSSINDRNVGTETGTLERRVGNLHITEDVIKHPTYDFNQSATMVQPHESPVYNRNAAVMSTPTIPAETQIPPSYRQSDKIIVNGNEYTMFKEIGKGGTSKVYLVSSHVSGEIYALKWIEIKKRDDFQNTVNEIELLKSLKEEENIIDLVDYSATPSTIFMIMEYGEIDLATLIQLQAKKEWDILFIKYYWKQMLYAVNAIHRRFIVHSDLKPANFVLAKGQLKLIDFGIAKKHGDDTTSIHREIQVGTINYMSPEALLDLNEDNDGGSLMKLGTSSDIWSLACILYQMVYGKTPFYHLTIAQKVANIPNPRYKINFSKEILYGPRNTTVQIPDELILLLSRCLNRSPKLRPTISELINHPFLTS
ncbi:kinase-like protein [Rhizopus microsporus]|uniref:Kinase-like protein n=1 Tax=Rhizopus microsporus TaxID=58291 RepID=A0A1X0S1K4_RHIZD|nr:kinase-like protein [Rhizopus microsporus]